MTALVGQTTGERSRHFIHLDWLRFLASLFVVLAHARIDHWVAWEQLETVSRNLVTAFFLLVIQVGPKPVLLFFVLSGFLVGGGVIRKCREDRFRAGIYFRDRLTRIYTPYLPALALTLGCVYYLHAGIPDYVWPQLAGNIAQMQGILCEVLEGNASLWTLSYETWFYTIAGAAGILWSTLRQGGSFMRILLGVSLGGLALGCLLVLDPVYLACWLLGALASTVDLRRVKRLAFSLATAAILLGYASLFLARVSPGSGFESAGILLIGAAMAVLLAGLMTNTGNSRGFAPALASRLAAFSYTLYLTHFPLQLVMRTWHAPYPAITPSTLATYFAKVAICLLVAWLFYLPFERNTGKVRAFVTRLASRTTAKTMHSCAKSS